MVSQKLLQVALFRAVHGNAPVGCVGVATCGGVTSVTSAGRDGCLQRYEYVAAALRPAIERYAASAAAPVQGGVLAGNGAAASPPPLHNPSHDRNAQDRGGWPGNSARNACRTSCAHPAADEVLGQRRSEHPDYDSPGHVGTRQTAVCESAGSRTATRAALLQGGKQRGNRQSRPPQRLQPHYQPLVPTVFCPFLSSCFCYVHVNTVCCSSTSHLSRQSDPTTLLQHINVCQAEC